MNDNEGGQGKQKGQTTTGDSGLNPQHSSTRIRKTPLGDPKFYDYIAVVLFCAFAICCSMVLFLNVTDVQTTVEENFGRRKAFILQLYFWAALGAIVTAYKFAAEDKERNELEDIKDNPDLIELRWPSSQDVVFYILRILMSGAMGVVGVAILLAGLGAFDGIQQEWGMKQKMMLIVFAFVVGMYQADFIGFVCGIKEQFFKAKSSNDKAEKEKAEQPKREQQLRAIQQRLRDLINAKGLKAKALDWIGKEYPPDKVEVAYKRFDYSGDPEVFIANPPGEDRTKILSRLLKALSDS